MRKERKQSRLHVKDREDASKILTAYSLKCQEASYRDAAALYGELAESVLMAGGKVTGVEPQFFLDMGFEYPEITQLIVTQDMSERKAKMVELGDAFIAFPGGTGTLEEISEIMSKVVLGHLDAPCIVYNLNGYYDDLRRLLDHMVEMELASEESLQGVTFAGNLGEIVEILEA